MVLVWVFCGRRGDVVFGNFAAYHGLCFHPEGRHGENWGCYWQDGS